MNQLKEENTETAKKRILCIDGGGILGTFPATFLAELEKHHSTGEYFGLIAESSTGGVDALGLGMGISKIFDKSTYKKHMTAKVLI